MNEDKSGLTIWAMVIPMSVIAGLVVGCSPTLTPATRPSPSPPVLRATTSPSSTPTLTPSPAPSPSPTEAAAGRIAANVEHGRQLFNRLGCVGCHGPQGEGSIGPTIAQTRLSLSTVIRQYRAPYQNMPRFGPDQVSEADIADIYAFLRTLPTPQTRVPSVLITVTPEAGIGAVRGVIRYDTGAPAADEQIYLVPATEAADGTLTFHYLPHLPAGTTDAQGRFEIADLEARLYAVFYTRQEAPVQDVGGNIVLVSVLPGEVAEIAGVIPAP